MKRLNGDNCCQYKILNVPYTRWYCISYLLLQLSDEDLLPRNVGGGRREFGPVLLDSGLQPVDEAEDVFPADQFMRVHRSFIVAKDKISSFSQTEIELDHQTNHLHL